MAHNNKVYIVDYIERYTYLRDLQFESSKPYFLFYLLIGKGIDRKETILDQKNKQGCL